MKKLIFTAIALIAFSIASHANINNSNDQKKAEPKKEIVKKDCAKVAALMCEFCEEIMDECASSEDYNEMYYIFESICRNS